MAKSGRCEQGLAWEKQARDRAIEQWVESQIDRLIDPNTTQDERERRIHRLTEGPPEFVNFRLDLPARRPIES